MRKYFLIIKIIDTQIFIHERCPQGVGEDAEPFLIFITAQSLTCHNILMATRVKPVANSFQVINKWSRHKWPPRRAAERKKSIEW